MKKSGKYFISVLVVVSFLLASCKSRGLIEKRRYTKGYYVGLHKRNSKFGISNVTKHTNHIKINSKVSESEQPELIKETAFSSNVLAKQIIVDTIINTTSKAPLLKIKKGFETKSKEAVKASTRLHNAYGNTCNDYWAWFLVLLLAVLYCLVVYGWMLLLAGILAISIVPVIPIGVVVFGVLMAGLTLFGAYYLFNFDGNDKLKWWQVLLITELLIPALAALVMLFLYLSAVK